MNQEQTERLMAENERLRKVLNLIRLGIEHGMVKSKPIMPEFDENATSVEFVSLASVIDEALSGAPK